MTREDKIKSLKKVIALLVLLITSTYVTSFASSTLFSLVVYNLSGYDYGELYLLDSLYNIFVYVCTLLLPAVLFMLIRRLDLLDCTDFSDLTDTYEGVSVRSVLCYFLCAFAMSCAMSYLTSFFSIGIGLDNSVFERDGAGNFAEYTLDIISIAILPAIIEELFFRGILLRELLPYGKGFAITVSAVFFASVHGSLEQMAYSFVYGLLFAVIAVKTGSIVTGVIIHFLNNAFSCTWDLLLKLLPESTFNILFGTVSVLMITAGLVLCVYLIGKGGFDIGKDDDDALSCSDGFSTLLSPAFIGYCVLVVAETAVTYFWG